MDALTEGCSAAAAAFGVGVVILKTALFQGIDVINLNVFQERDTVFVDDDLQVPLGRHEVVVKRLLLKTHIIGKPRASAGQNPDAQKMPGLPIFLHHRLDLRDSRVSQRHEVAGIFFLSQLIFSCVFHGSN